MSEHRALAAVMPRSPSELLAVAELLDAHRQFVERCGVAWPLLSDEIVQPGLILATLDEVRRAHSARRSAPSNPMAAGARVR